MSPISQTKSFVCIHNVFSDAGTVKYSALQGSIVRLLLFLLHINNLPQSSEEEYFVANTIFKYWIGIVLGYIHEMFKLSLCRCSTRSQMALNIPLQKTNIEQKSLFF